MLIALRALMAPLMVALALAGTAWAPGAIVAAMTIGLVSDIFDGIVARRLGVATPLLRRLDSQTDAVFWLAALASAWILHPAVLVAAAPWIGLVVVLELLCYALSFARFGRETSTHALLSKLWGLFLFAGFVSLVLSGAAGPLFYAMIAVGVLSQLDVIAIVLLLPRWTNDVPSAWHAWQLRRGRTIRRHSLFN
jgi:CDP-diacylglycerol--glycerol-3-phosphate 3-phosphatidyltransferase